jgi:RimJ/RimL family protein N-acetyltransferase
MKSLPEPVKVTENLQFNLMKPEDAESMALLADDYSIWINSRGSMPYPYTYFDALDFILRVRQDIHNRVMGLYEANHIIGIFSLFPGTDVHRLTAEVGYWIGAPYRNKGIASLALKKWCEAAFADYGFIKLKASVFEGNIASARVLEKCGFTGEAILRKEVFKNGKLLDEWRYALFNPGGKINPIT